MKVRELENKLRNTGYQQNLLGAMSGLIAIQWEAAHADVIANMEEKLNKMRLLTKIAAPSAIGGLGYTGYRLFKDLHNKKRHKT